PVSAIEKKRTPKGITQNDVVENVLAKMFQWRILDKAQPSDNLPVMRNPAVATDHKTQKARSENPLYWPSFPAAYAMVQEREDSDPFPVRLTKDKVVVRL